MESGNIFITVFPESIFWSVVFISALTMISRLFFLSLSSSFLLHFQNWVNYSYLRMCYVKFIHRERGREGERERWKEREREGAR